MNNETDGQLLRSMLLEMHRIRMIEQAIAKRYSEQEMRCPVHLSIGQECVPVAMSAVLRSTDLAVSAHRSHAHYLAKGGALNSMLAELYGKATGCARGRGGSMHLIDPDAGLIAAVPIVGSATPIGVGIAWAKKLKEEDDIVVIYLGDGSTEEGSFTESLDFALLHGLRVIFVVENNFYSVYTHLRDRQSPLRTIAGVARGHGIDAFAGDGNDALETLRLATEAVTIVREEARPILLELSTYRWLEHCGPNSDDHLNYRDSVELSRWLANDPIRRLENHLRENDMTNLIPREGDFEATRAEILEAFDFALASPFPAASELLRDIYA